MRAGDFVREYIPEGGWDTTVTQGTVITPAVVKRALKVAEKFARDFNKYLDQLDIPAIEIGHPTGSSAYHDVDAEDKVEAFLPTVDQLVTEGLVTLEAVRIVRYVSPDSR